MDIRRLTMEHWSAWDSERLIEDAERYCNNEESILPLNLKHVLKATSQIINIGKDIKQIITSYPDKVQPTNDRTWVTFRFTVPVGANQTAAPTTPPAPREPSHRRPLLLPTQSAFTAAVLITPEGNARRRPAAAARIHA